jgi:hypothetical protein
MSVRPALRGFALALAVVCGIRSAAARALLETFDDTGLPPDSSSWVASGSFTNSANGLVWDYTSARGNPQIESGNPALVLRGGSAAQRGTLASQTELTNGIGRISFTAKLASDASNAVIRLDLLADGVFFGTCAPDGGREPVRVETVPTAAPLTAVSSFCISNRGASCVLDDLEIDPFRLFVSLSCGPTNEVPLSREFDVEAELIHASTNVAFSWSISPGFAGGANDWNDPHLTLTPDSEDLGKTFTLTARLEEADDPETFAEASCTFTVTDSMNPRFLDFERLSTVNYETNNGAIVPMRGMNWRWFNVCTSDRRDAKIGEKSARFRHTSQELPAILESQDPFDGVGAVTLHCACFQDNGPVDFELQVCGDGEDWSAAGTFSSRDCHDITNCVFIIPVDRIDPVCVRIVSVSGSGAIADIDDVSIFPYGESPPVLSADIPAVVALGRPAEILFTLLHADGIVRDWEGNLDPPSGSAAFEVAPGDDYLFSFAPAVPEEWGTYVLGVSATLADGTVCRTQAVLSVVSAPAFELAGTSSVEVPGVVDVSVTNVELHGTNTEWKTVWDPDPPFANEPSLAHKSRYRIAKGTTADDLGGHVLAAVLTDTGTSASTTNFFPILVLETPLPPDPGEAYVIESFSLTNLTLRAGNADVRLFTPFAVATPSGGAGEAEWIWSAPPVESAGPARLEFDLSGCTNPAAVFGVRISGGP